MSRLYKLNAGQATSLAGPYVKTGFSQSRHTCQPIEIEFPNFYVLHEEITSEPEIAKRFNDWQNLPIFTIGDGSPDDLIYQQYLADQQ